MVPCLICGEVGGGGEHGGVVKVEVLDLEESTDQLSWRKWKWSEDEKRIYLWFVTWFKLEGAVFKKAGKGKRISNLGWEVDVEDTEDFPFCGGCGDKLGGLVELQRKLEELEGMIREGVEELKIKANGCEDKIEKMGIYGRDGRYRRVRTLIVTDFRTRYSKKRGGGDAKAIRTRQSKPVAEKHLEALIPPKDTVEVEANPSCLDVIGGNSMEVPSISSLKRTCRSSKVTDKQLEVEVMEEQASFFDNNDSFDDDNSDDLHIDEDYNPESPPPPPSGRRKTKRKVRVVVEEDDQDISEQFEEENKDKEWEKPNQSSDDQSSEDDDLLEPDFDTRKKPRCQVDPEKGTLTFKNVVFHLQEPPTLKMYKCSECQMNIKFGSNHNIRSHFIKYHSNCHLCKKCDYRANNKSRLKQHVAVIHDGIPSKKKVHKLKPCPICQRPCTGTSMKTHLWSHKSLEERQQALQTGGEYIPHQQLKKHQCDLCGHKFGSNYMLEQHKESVHDAQNKKELCSECGGTFKDLKRHQRSIHEGGGRDGDDANAKKFTCLEPGCGKKFQKLSQMTRHKDATHRKIRPWKCSRCPRAFTDEKKLKYHEGIHDGIRPWKCDLCPSSFGRNSHLQVHMKAYHSGGPEPKRRPYRRGTTMLPRDVKKQDLVNDGKYLPPSALQTWAAGREPTSHFLIDSDVKANATSSQDNYYYH